MLSLEFYLGNSLVRLVQCALKRVSIAGNTQNTSTVCVEFAVLILSACVINKRSVYLTLVVHTEHLETLFVLNRISSAGHNNTSAVTRLPADLDISQPVFINSLKYLAKIALQHRKNYLRFRVAETAVVFNYLWTIRGEHKSEIQTALKSPALSVHCIDSRQEDLLHALLGNVISVVRVRCNSTHSACVQTLVAVQRSLVIH